MAVDQGANFESVLELAPGAGRNTAKLVQVATTLQAVDLNEYALERLRERFKDYAGRCNLHIHQNNGSDLKMIGDGSVTFIYCWDAAVHFDKTVIRGYIREFSRVLSLQGTGFIHHSNLGGVAETDIRLNPRWRSNMDKTLFRQYSAEAGLEVIEQVDVPWGEITDCISIFRKSHLGR